MLVVIAESGGPSLVRGGCWGFLGGGSDDGSQLRQIKLQNLRQQQRHQAATAAQPIGPSASSYVLRLMQCFAHSTLINGYTRSSTMASSGNRRRL